MAKKPVQSPDDTAQRRLQDWKLIEEKAKAQQRRLSAKEKAAQARAEKERILAEARPYLEKAARDLHQLGWPVREIWKWLNDNLDSDIHPRIPLEMVREVLGHRKG